MSAPSETPGKVTSPSGSSSGGASTALTTADPLGRAGKAMTEYHIGDLTGLIGILFSLIGFWYTYKEARGARTAAEQARTAAQHALAQRDRLEAAAEFAELAIRLRELRDQAHQDDWSRIGWTFDSAVKITVRLSASPQLRAEEVKLMEDIRKRLRTFQQETHGVKDTTKRTPLKKDLFGIASNLHDQVEEVHAKRLKDGTSEDSDAH